MDNKLSDMPVINKYIIRKTGEEVEVIANYQPNSGERNSEDWVTYIDSKGEEHIKEHLNMQLDFKPGKDFTDLFGKIFDTPKFEPLKFPSTENARAFETAKELLVHRNISLEEAISVGKKLTEAFKE